MYTYLKNVNNKINVSEKFQLSQRGNVSRCDGSPYGIAFMHESNPTNERPLCVFNVVNVK